DIVTRHLTEKSVAEEPGSQSELTPSESLVTTDNDVSEKDVRVKIRSRRRRAAEGDSVDSESLLSTSSNLEPFASDDLGNTVIHLDKALVRMREFERMKLKAGFPPPPLPPPPPPALASAAAATASVSTAPSVSNSELSAVTAAAATGAGGHPSANQGQDMRCPQINTQQLDRQIKAIMTEVIPFLKVRALPVQNLTRVQVYHN
ncbi:pericentriolar material 1 protein isoform X1, partial [Tachysurus ichikawai]